MCLLAYIGMKDDHICWTLVLRRKHAAILHKIQYSVLHKMEHKSNMSQNENIVTTHMDNG